MKNYTTPNYYQLGEWIDAWQEPLYRYAFFRLGHRDEAEDVVQDAFLKIASSSIQIKNPKAYLFRMVANGCVDTLRRRGRNISLVSQIATPAESYDIEAEEEYQRIAALLSHLHEKEAEVIRLHIHAGLKFTEIAELLDTPATTLKSRFASGITHLRQMLIN